MTPKWLKRLFCKHDRMIKFYPEKVTWKNMVSGVEGKHDTVVIEGCLNCNKTWVRDYGE